MLIDLDATLNAATLDVWGVAVTYTPLVSVPGRAAFALTATFVRDHVMVLTEIASSEMKAAGHSTTAPMLGIRRSSIDFDPLQGDRFTVGGETFEVWDVQPDTHGWLARIAREIV